MKNITFPGKPKLCFATVCPGIVNRLINQVGIASSFSASGRPAGNIAEIKTYNALWDTGATCSCISEKVVRDLNLPIISKQEIKGATGAATKNVHVVEIFLPNNLRIEKVKAICADINDFDVLIGMDIISLGDFIISNFNRQTYFT